MTRLAATVGRSFHLRTGPLSALSVLGTHGWALEVPAFLSSGQHRRSSRARGLSSKQVVDTGRNMRDEGWETVIGLELHVQVSSKTKLFSGAAAEYGASPNTNVAPFDAALPGTLPALNRRSVELAARLGFALGGEVQRTSTFDRKHYFYPDLPHGYQITQQRSPIVLGGSLNVFFEPDKPPRTLHIERLQLEMDTGKSLHGEDRSRTMIDLNRAGSTLIEIVTRPDLRSAEEAAAAVETFQQVLRFLGVSSANMEEGSLRCDVNVSVRRRPNTANGAEEAPLGERVEVKNLNSFRSIARAVRHEAARHIDLLRDGAVVERQTRTFDANSGRTVLLRSKEELLDYRFLPEPDLPPLVLDQQYLDKIKESVPELPSAAQTRLQLYDGLPSKLAAAVVGHPSTLAYYEAALSSARAHGGEETTAAVKPLDVANWVVGELVGAARSANVSSLKDQSLLGALPPSVSAARSGELLAMVSAGRVSRRMAKDMLEAMLGGDNRPIAEVVVDVCGGEQIGGSDELRALCEEIVAEMPEEAELCRAGGKKGKRLMGLFVGEAMKRTGGRANPKEVSEILMSLLVSSPD